MMMKTTTSRTATSAMMRMTAVMMVLLSSSSNHAFVKAADGDGFCHWGPDGTAATSVCQGASPQGGDWCNANQNQCVSGCSGNWCDVDDGGATTPSEGGFCNWGSDGTGASSVCEGGAQGGEWCNANQNQCEGGCGGKWCTTSNNNGSPSPPSGPSPSPPSSPATGPALYRENFESGTTISGYSFNGNAETQAYTVGGADGRILRARYPPASNGSPRLVKRFNLQNTVSEATLSFDMKLHSQFEFVKGGKLHGLGGGSGTTGCRSIDPNGWSVRMMWRRNGVPELYIYGQDRQSNCGDSYPATTGFTFSKGPWYRIDIQVKMNSAVGAGNGRAALYIDGVLQAEANNLNLTGNDSVQIDKFMFSTFYGGSSPDWAPSKTTYCYFDNFSVMSGLSVTGTQGTDCEIFEQGIYSAGNEVCCADSCGSCGGSGCSGRPGGASSCCTGDILDNAPTCSSSSSAPCKF